MGEATLVSERRVYETVVRDTPEGTRHVVRRIHSGRHRVVGVYKDAQAAEVLRAALITLSQFEA